MTARAQSANEELANTVSHGVGALLALAATVPLVVRAVRSGSGKAVFSLGAYALSLILLYSVSAVYHGTRKPERKAVLRVMDHDSIYLLIPGTYIPMSLLVIGGRMGGMLFLTNSALAAVGVTLNAIDLERFDKVSLALYALMGQLVVVAMRSVVAVLHGQELILLAAGGVAVHCGDHLLQVPQAVYALRLAPLRPGGQRAAIPVQSAGLLVKKGGCDRGKL